jgi:hypothetical protein
LLDKAEFNVEYLYAFVERCGDNAVIIFRFDDTDQAIATLLANFWSASRGTNLSNVRSLLTI